MQPTTVPSRDSSFGRLFAALLNNVERVIQGKREQVHLALVCLLAEGHLLIEDVPGVGKTSLAKAIARVDRRHLAPHPVHPRPPALRRHRRLGVEPRRRASSSSGPGGVFANIVLADEINRASPKTQSALLEAMEERQVTVDAHTLPRSPRPFMVIATQNPIELEGTYPLPEAQLDRFLMRIPMGYPDRDAEIAILEAQGHASAHRRRARRRWRARSTSPTPPVAVGSVHVAAEAARLHRRPRRRDPPPSRPRARREPPRVARRCSAPPGRSPRASAATT